jgi:hypothetical protein
MGLPSCILYICVQYWLLRHLAFYTYMHNIWSLVHIVYVYMCSCKCILHIVQMCTILVSCAYVHICLILVASTLCILHICAQYRSLLHLVYCTYVFSILYICVHYLCILHICSILNASAPCIL